MGEKSANIIELNGRRYDAHTGKLLDGVHSHSSNQPRAHAVKAQHRSVKPLSDIQVAKPRAAHAKAPHVQPHQLQRPKTLMRRSIAKPTHDPKPVLKAQSPVRRSSDMFTVRQKLSAATVHPGKAQLAALTPKSPAVSRYSKPVTFKPNMSTHQPAIAQPSTKQLPANITHANQKGKAALFEKAIANAVVSDTPAKKVKDHKIKKSLKRQKSVFAVAATVSVITVVGAFVALANMSQIELKVANMRAGISADMPNYQPIGFSKSGPVSYQAGKVSVSFSANNGQREYTLSQEESDWNSQTLYDNIVGQADNIQSVQQNGNTIYLYGNSQAAWVSGGILHDITGNANLNSDQLLRIANSI